MLGTFPDNDSTGQKSPLKPFFWPRVKLHTDILVVRVPLEREREVKIKLVENIHLRERITVPGTKHVKGASKGSLEKCETLHFLYYTIAVSFHWTFFTQRVAEQKYVENLRS